MHSAPKKKGYYRDKISLKLRVHLMLAKGWLPHARGPAAGEADHARTPNSVCIFMESESEDSWARAWSEGSRQSGAQPSSDAFIRFLLTFYLCAVLYALILPLLENYTPLGFLTDGDLTAASRQTFQY